MQNITDISGKKLEDDYIESYHTEKISSMDFSVVLIIIRSNA